MAFDLKASFDFEAAFDGLNRRLDEQNKRLREYLTRPHANVRQLFGTIPTTGTTPLIIDFGAPAGGQLWSVQQVTISANNPFISGAGSVATTTPVAASSGIVAAAVATATLPAVAGRTNSVSGFQITGLGATGATVVNATLTGVLGGTQTYEVTVPAGATTAITPVIVNFSPALPATGPNVAISLSVPSFGAGNTNAEANIQGTLSVAAVSAVSAGIFVGTASATNQFSTDMGSLVATGLTVPVNYQAGGKSIIARHQQHLYVALTGNVTAFNQLFATATALEVPDTSEALLWL